MEAHQFHLSTALTLGFSNCTASTSTKCHYPEHQISTDLVLCDPTWNWNLAKQRKTEESPVPKCKNLLVKNQSAQIKPESDQEPWTIRKKLTVSDLGSCSRLLIPKAAVTKHVLPYLEGKLAESVISNEGAQVTVHDADTNSMHQLTFKYWASAGSYVLNGVWRQVFVHGKGLKENDEIGLYWDASKSMFVFTAFA